MKRFIPHGTFEVLEAKRMNAANLIGNAMAAMPATSSTVQTSTSGSGAANLGSNLNQTSAGVNAGGSTAGSVNTGVGSLNAGANVAGSTHSSAGLSGTGHGIVNLVNGLANGGTHANLVVHVSGAPANQTFDVSLGGNVVGSISTNAQGNGILHLNTALNNADQLIAALPNLGANAGVNVGVSGQTPILSGSLGASANVGAAVSGLGSTVSGALGAVSNLENAVIPRLDSLIDKLDSTASNAVDHLMTVTGTLDNVANRLVNRVDNLTAAVVDKVFNVVDHSAILGDVLGLLNSDVTHVV